MFEIFKKRRRLNKNIAYEQCNFMITASSAKLCEVPLHKPEEIVKFRYMNSCKYCGAPVLNENETVCDTCKSTT